MFTLFLRLAWPYLMRFLANQAADYLERRREEKLAEVEARRLTGEYLPAAEETEAEVSTSNAIWYSLSGVLLGSALSLILYILLQEDER